MVTLRQGNRNRKVGSLLMKFNDFTLVLLGLEVLASNKVDNVVR